MLEYRRRFANACARPTGLFDRGRVRSLLFGLAASTCLVTASGAKAQILNPVAAPADPAQVTPIERVPRSQFGVVGNFPLSESDLNNLFFPSATEAERQAALEGLDFFTTAAFRWPKAPDRSPIRHSAWGAIATRSNLLKSAAMSSW